MKEKIKKLFKEIWKAFKGVVKEYHDNNKSDEEKAIENLLNDYIDFDYKTKIRIFFNKLFKAKK